MTDSARSSLELQVLAPAESRRLEPSLAAAAAPDIWVYRYRHPREDWTLSIATHGVPGSGSLSLGGFRIAPELRTSLADYDNDREAIELALGMEEKIYWSRLLRVGGPLLLSHPAPLVGGKCVLKPTADSRVGQPRDFEMLDFAIAALGEVERRSGVHVVTGQDLGHGTMSDGNTASLAYLHRGYAGSVTADTGKPTAEGNYRLLRGMLAALDIPLAGAKIGLIGCGNIGEHVLSRITAEGAEATVVEAVPARREAMASAYGVRMLPPEQKEELLRLPIDAVVVNASGGSLDPRAVSLIAANPAIRVVCGSENLTMPDPSGAEALRAAGKLFAPTELGGMVGYLTATEEYLARCEGIAFDIDTMFVAAERLETAGRKAAARVRESGFRLAFEEAMKTVYPRP